MRQAERVQRGVGDERVLESEDTLVDAVVTDVEDLEARVLRQPRRELRDWKAEGAPARVPKMWW